MTETENSDVASGGATGTRPVKKKKGSARLLQLILVVAVVALIWFSFGQNVLAPKNRDGVPERLGDLELVNSTKGEEALRRLDRLHGTSVSLDDAYIAGYSTSGREEDVLVWVGTAVTSKAADDLISRMVAGINNGNAGFRNLRQINIVDKYANHPVFRVDGPGGDHFFYISPRLDRVVVWISVENGNALSILADALDIY